jgi:hypothetical protein
MENISSVVSVISPNGTVVVTQSGQVGGVPVVVAPARPGKMAILAGKINKLTINLKSLYLSFIKIARQFDGFTWVATIELSERIGRFMNSPG